MKPLKRHKMVGWYDPIQLGRTAVEVLISTILGRHADKRVLQALADSGDLRRKYYYEVCDLGGEEFWFDYIADVGDGFDPTFTMAQLVTRSVLDLRTKENPKKKHRTSQGKILVFGGDEVYPIADWNSYQERLVEPYNATFPKKTPAQKKDPKNLPLPAIFAVPGNHDWYDSLVAFSTLFSREKEFCGWKCEQNRSYFAAKLPGGWWLFGTDMQLGSSLDEAQMAYFEKIVKGHFGPNDRIILCNAEPHWITASMYPKERAFSERNMGYFEGHILDHRVAVYIAGDRHYYKRHEEVSKNGKPIDPSSQTKLQKIVAGGGGAFLHPTHKEKVEHVGFDHVYAHKKSFPDETTSFRLTFWNLLFVVWNWKFGFVTGGLYLLTAQAFLADLGRFGFGKLTEALANVGVGVLTKPIALLWVLLILIGFFFFTDTHSRIYRFAGGFFHAASHLFAILLIGWGVASWVGGGKPIELFALVEFLQVGALIFAGGFIAGSVIMGHYLLISLNIFGRHHNETFSAIKVADFKNFVRFKIEENGDLVIFPVGVERITKWKKGETGRGKIPVVPVRIKNSNEPFLIEEPIKFAKSILDKAAEAAPDTGSGKKGKVVEPTLLRKIEI